MGSRRRLLRLGLAAAAAAVVPAARAARKVSFLSGVRIGNGGHAFAGDSATLTTLSPLPGRNVAHLRFVLERSARVVFEVLQTGQGAASEQPVSSGSSALGSRTLRLPAGEHVLDWRPAPSLPARTYILRVTVAGSHSGATARSVARLLGVDAGFLVRSATGGDTAELLIRTDAANLTARILHSGPETEPTYANDLVNGVAVTEPATIDWTRHADRPAAIGVRVGDEWPSGVYFARLDADDGRSGFAPLIVRPAAPRRRVAVVMPTSTWQAYNFYDEDGNGWGDTWYARWATKTIDLARPMAFRGVPYRYRSYDLAFQHWLAETGKEVDVYADEDLELFPDPQALRTAYDLLVFPGHTEYVTTGVYDLVEGYRDLGGNLLFLSANNFFRRVDRLQQTLTLIDEWRNLGRPEAALLGVQYVASDRGEHQQPFVVNGAEAAPWAFAGTGLVNGSTFGRYGIEIDARSPESPPQTQVLATIPDLLGPGRTAEMTYYEDPSGARVFSAGALNFAGQVTLWPETRQLLENVWQRLTAAR